MIGGLFVVQGTMTGNPSKASAELSQLREIAMRPLDNEVVIADMALACMPVAEAAAHEAA